MVAENMHDSVVRMTGPIAFTRGFDLARMKYGSEFKYKIYGKILYPREKGSRGGMDSRRRRPVNPSEQTSCLWLPL